MISLGYQVLSRKELKKIVDDFRKKFHGNSVPVDIVNIIELKLKILIVSVPGLRTNHSVEALIMSNWRHIHVDQGAYDNEEPRLNFSLAHELGHFLLHKDFYTSLNIKGEQDYYDKIELISKEDWSIIESQCNIFANFLLVPRENLEEEVRNNKILQRIKKDKEFIKKIDKTILKSILAEQLSKKFSVSAEVIGWALSDVPNLDELFVI